MRRGTTLAVLPLVLVLASCASEAPAPDEDVAGSPAGFGVEDRELDSLSLIETAMLAGRVDYSTGVLYKVYTMFEPMSLPDEFQSDVPAKCGTPLIIEVQRNWNRLTPEHRAEISQYIEPLTEGDGTETQLDDVTPDRLDHERERLD